MTEREEIEQRLEYLYQHPDEIEYHVLRGHSGPYSQWTNSYMLQRELWAIGVIDRMDALDTKLGVIRENQRHLIEFVRYYDGWVNGTMTLEQLRKARIQI